MNRYNNFVAIQDKIAKAAHRAGRNADEVTILAVSKRFPAEIISEVYQFGIRAFGESRAQELRDKIPQCPQDIAWHFIGPLQTNKIKYVVPNVRLIHVIDSLKLAASVSLFAQKKNIKVKILAEINTSAEDAKHGFSCAQAIDSVLELTTLENIEVAGLMTMAPWTDDTAQIRKSFKSLKKTQEQLRDQSDYDFNVLSMGMSGDFEIAIEEGSTIVRIGTGIFGNRP